MKIGKLADILLNCVLPVLIGCWLYIAGNHLYSLDFIRNHLADGLWAYAFLSSILIIWERRVNYYWITVCFGAAIIFEWLQHKQVIAGTGDFYDILIYIAGFCLSLCINYLYQIKNLK